MISAGFFFFFKKKHMISAGIFWAVRGVKGQKMDQNEKLTSVTHHISGTV